MFWGYSVKRKTLLLLKNLGAPIPMVSQNQALPAIQVIIALQLWLHYSENASWRTVVHAMYRLVRNPLEKMVVSDISKYAEPPRGTEY